jgi:hypothetical protein
VTDFEAIAGPLQLTLPVLTSPDIVQLAVAGIYSCTIALSWSNVEPTLVLANSIGVPSANPESCHMLALYGHVYSKYCLLM